MTLYDYFRSSAAYRVRIALNLKGLRYDSHPVSLVDKAQQSPAYQAINPAQLVPTLETEQGYLSQSLAIIEYLDECYPENALLPSDPWQKAQCRALALSVACDIHPVNNLRVLNYLTGELAVSQEDKLIWYHHWLKAGLAALETQLAARHQQHSTTFCCGDTPMLADLCLVPQLYNARRFELDLSPYPSLTRIEQACQQLKAFKDAHPENQAI
ncbi:maleylacetoacetate isomerase (plasmid) [Photobacterium sp. GJ3]|uniref:maleylacetoacetate isomerase n=1 Tax=Photobacterium sp. GJ3 TaxID=2829502 RepID=UPI001B8BB1A3|nr:maleylacetoacetate isomerase [Photobacterium sp. GJ3]QUJ69449.1 maleylacetoacetate isomerase [Photobacterium sp. GJ3]